MNETYTINGETKPFLDWCQEYEVSPLQVRASVSLGNLLGDALQTKTCARVVLFTLNGQTNSLREWCRMYEIDPSTFKKRVQSGYTLQEALESKRYDIYRQRPKTKKASEHTITKPFLEWCKDYKVDPLHIRAAMSKGYNLHYALLHTTKGRINQLVMQVEGKTDTFLQFCTLYQKASNTVRRRIAAGIPLDDAFTLDQLPWGGVKSLQEAGCANEPHSITQPLTGWCQDYRVPPAVVKLRLELGAPIARAVHTLTLEELEQNSKEVTIPELCEVLGVDADVVLGNMAHGMNLLEALGTSPIDK